MQSESYKASGTIGVISDTHGMLRLEVSRIFKGVDIIVHAGDVGGIDILNSLESIAPVTAVRGNVDGGVVSAFLNESETFEFRGIKIHLLHDLSRLSIDPKAHGVKIVVNGHSHLPEVINQNGIIYLNPGSAGPRRANKPISVAKVTIQDGLLLPKHFHMEEIN